MQQALRGIAAKSARLEETGGIGEVQHGLLGSIADLDLARVTQGNTLMGDCMTLAMNSGLVIEAGKISGLIPCR